MEFDNFKPRLKSGIFKCISLLNGSFFGGDDRDFLKEGVKIYQTAPMSPLDLPTFFSVFTSIVYGSIRKLNLRLKSGVETNFNKILLLTNASLFGRDFLRLGGSGLLQLLLSLNPRLFPLCSVNERTVSRATTLRSKLLPALLAVVRVHLLVNLVHVILNRLGSGANKVAPQTSPAVAVLERLGVLRGYREPGEGERLLLRWIIDFERVLFNYV